MCPGATHNSKMEKNSKCDQNTSTIFNTINIQSKSSAATQTKEAKEGDQPRLPKIKWSKIKLTGKVHGLPITKDYVLREFADLKE